MAVTKASNCINVTSTATLVLAGDADRRGLLLSIVGKGRVWIGPDNTVAQDAGYYWTDEMPVIEDNAPSTDDWYAICRDGETAQISYLSMIDE